MTSALDSPRLQNIQSALLGWCDQLDRLLQKPEGQSLKALPLYAPIREQLGERGQGYMALGQINTSPGDLAGNASKIMAYIETAEALGLDLIAFPELALMGYPPRDVIMRHPFLVQENLKWLEAIAQRTGQTYALVGFVEPRNAVKQPVGNLADAPPAPGKRYGKPYYNAMAVLGEGNIQGIVRKCLLPTTVSLSFQPIPGYCPLVC
jgi:predicted amidohydrolase